jgi:histidine ammonia-lyase
VAASPWPWRLKPSKAFVLGGPVTLEDLRAVCAGRAVVFPGAARSRVASARKRLLKAASTGAPIYGVNTGFGELASKRIPDDRLVLLQRNLVRSHAAGVGAPLPFEEARGVLFLRANELARGFSGCSTGLVELMAKLLNAGAAPFIPRRGSVGASGDLSPQAHMALLLIGEGKAYVKGRLSTAAQALKAARSAAITLGAKEGLSLVNGTQGMQSVGGSALLDSYKVLWAAQAAGALSVDGLMATPAPFDEAIHKLKPHAGQKRCAASLRALLNASEIREAHIEGDPRVQDPYSLRCMPQVHGAALDQLDHARGVVETEMLSCTDNPLVVGGRVVSGGNFHGQPLSFAFDTAAIALAALANISERRVYLLTSALAPGLSLFLAQDPGLESGWMSPQYTAAALASENKGLAHPASADSVPTCAGKEDFVSMGMGAALKLRRSVWNAAQIVAIELLCAAEAVEARRPLKTGPRAEQALSLVRKAAPPRRGDESLSGRMEAVRELVLSGAFDSLAA